MCTHPHPHPHPLTSFTVARVVGLWVLPHPSFSEDFNELRELDSDYLHIRFNDYNGFDLGVEGGLAAPETRLSPRPESVCLHITHTVKWLQAVRCVCDWHPTVSSHLLTTLTEYSVCSSNTNICT